MTERFPGEADGVVVKPGDPCTVKIGDDLVITGYIDRYHPSITPTGHAVIALRLYRDAGRADEIARETAAPHPLFQPVTFQALAS